MTSFYLPSTSQSTTSTPASLHSSDDEEDTLPYPATLDRTSFLSPSFDPLTYLSSLGTRHQTLEDLRSDLRSRSQLLNRELLDLVNSNYEEFLSLGENLKGGEEKIEGVRIGVLGLQREVEGVLKVVKEREVEVGALVRERKEVRREVGLGRALLEIEARLGEMEKSLGITGSEQDDDATDLEDEDDDNLDGDDTMLSRQVRRVRRHAQQYLLITQQVEHIGPSHPFLQAQQPRLAELRKTLLLDLAAALRQAKVAKAPDAILALTCVYVDLGAERESLRVLKGG